MNSILKFIAFPITFIIGFITALFVIFFNLNNIGLVKNNKLTKGELLKRLYSDFDNFFLNEEWKKIPPFFRMLIALAIYYIFI